jgi:predicted transcriptional regulator
MRLTYFARIESLSTRVAAARLRKEMSTLQEIKSAIANLSPHDKALLTAELFAMNAEPDRAALEAALERGLKDVEAGRVRPVEQVKAMIPRWTSKS